MLETMFYRELVLRPNCLLTRRPIRIDSGPSCFFSWRDPWKGLRHYLGQHGYPLTKDSSISAHVLCKNLDAWTTSPLSTLTVIVPHPLSNLPHGAFQILTEPKDSEEFYSLVLDHCIHLAELDYLND